MEELVESMHNSVRNADQQKFESSFNRLLSILPSINVRLIDWTEIVKTSMKSNNKEVISFLFKNVGFVDNRHVSDFINFEDISKLDEDAKNTLKAAAESTCREIKEVSETRIMNPSLLQRIIGFNFELVKMINIIGKYNNIESINKIYNDVKNLVENPKMDNNVTLSYILSATLVAFKLTDNSGIKNDSFGVHHSLPVEYSGFTSNYVSDSDDSVVGQDININLTDYHF